ncbi:MAG: hypothetical protein A2W23_02390 [Planctomycetes bacterium RBG_16_43_13]|nr:MAG: hypothetical protein A2W23_02390 [Planctomycetes bacterium RBG_16_43_13]
MPTISMFYGIIVRMYCGKAEHNPPHFHAYYQDYKAVVDITTCDIIDGNLPSKQAKLVLAWAELHKDELAADWVLASKGELPFKIEPLK